MSVVRYQTPEGHRYYETPLGLFPSVTTVLGATRAPEEEAGLERWRQRVGRDEAERIRVQAARRGTSLHHDIEMKLGQGIDPDRICPFWTSISPFLPRVRKVVFVERTVWHPLGFAGTMDLCAYVDSDPEPAVLDWKTKSARWTGLKKVDHCCQVAACSGGLLHVERILAPRAYVVTGYGDGGPYDLISIRPGQLVAWWKVFRHRLEVFRAAHRPVEADLVPEP